MPRTRWSRASTALLVVSAVMLVSCVEARRDAAGEITEAGRISVFDMQVGDCFDDPREGSIESVPAVPCGEPHDNEVYALPHFPAGQGEPYPSDEMLRGYADEACREGFADYVGVVPEESVFTFTGYLPGPDTWVDGDREIVCFLYHPDLEKLEGSMRGVAR
jgi:hypothetical protein